MQLHVHIQQGSSHLPLLPALPVPLHCFMLILLLFFSAGKELREDSKDYQQVLLDVRRSLRRFPPGEGGLCSSHSARARAMLWGFSWLRPPWEAPERDTPLLQGPDF